MAVRGNFQVRIVFVGFQCDEYTDYGVDADIRQAITYGCCDLDDNRPHVPRLSIRGKFLTGAEMRIVVRIGRIMIAGISIHQHSQWISDTSIVDHRWQIDYSA